MIFERKFTEMKRVLLVPLFLLLGLLVSFAAEEAKPTAPAAGPNKKVLVKSEADAGLYSKADTKSARLDMLEQFTPVEVLGVENEWTQVKTGEEKTGYVQSKNLSDSCFVSTKIAGGKKVNLRMGPESASPVSVELLSDYPLWVLEVKKVDKDVRIHVVDYEGDGGWAHKSFLSFDRYVVATPTEEVAWIPVREGAGTDKNGNPLFPRRFQAERGTAFKVLADKDGWLHVKHADGDEGWCSAKVVWGWNQPENPGKKVAKPAAAKPAETEKKAESAKKAESEKKSEAAKTSESSKKAPASTSSKKAASSKKGTTSSKKASSSKK